MTSAGGNFFFFEERFPPPKTQRGVSNDTVPIGLLPCFPVWDLIQKVALGHLTLDWNNELLDRNYIARSIAPVLVHSPFSLFERCFCVMLALKKYAQKNFGILLVTHAAR